MQDHLQQYIHDRPLKHDGDHRDLQRAALREMIRLSAEAVKPAESQVEQRFGKAKQLAQEKFQDESGKIEQRFRELKDKSRQTYDEQVKQTQDLFASDSNTLETNTKTTRERIVGDSDTTLRNAKKVFDNDVWLAETVVTATKKELQKEFKRIQKKIPADREQLESLQEQAQWLLQQYRQEITEEIPPVDEKSLATDDPKAAFDQQYASAEEYLDALENLTVPQLFIGIRCYIYITLFCIGSVGLMGLPIVLSVPHWPSFFVTGPIALLIALVIALTARKTLWRLTQSQVRLIYLPLQQTIAAAHVTLDRYLELAARQLKQGEADAIQKRDDEVKKSQDRFNAVRTETEQRRSSLLQQLEESHTKLHNEIEHRRNEGLRQAEEMQEKHYSDLQQRYDQDMTNARRHYEQRMNECQSQYQSARTALEQRWKDGLSCIKNLLEDTADLNRQPFFGWNDPRWPEWMPPRESATVVPFGYWQVDFKQLADRVLKHAPFQTDRSAIVKVPALLAFPDRCSLLLRTGLEGRDRAIETLRAVMLRLLTSLKPGRVRFTIIDPVGLGENFAGFMHLADYQESLVGGRIWTDSAHIEQRLTDLTDHMENVIQKYLRNEFETIDEYNLQAGELAEPYRFLVVANFPVNFNEEAARRLCSIISSGARCGVYTLIAHDTRQELPTGVQMEDLEKGGIHLMYKDDRFIWQDEIFRQFPLTLDTTPAEESLTRIMHVVGQGAKDSNRVEVPFGTIAPSGDKCWTSDSGEDLCVPIGRTGAVRLQHLRLGRGVAQHGLIAGKTGSGKSTMLHVIITNLALWYHPDEVEFYLVDFKKGVEFKTYATHELAHARVVAIESDREFGLSVLHRLDAELARRGDLFRRLGAQDLPAYRQTSDSKLPRILLIVDEFQVFFSEDDKPAQDAAMLLDRLVRQGRAFGIHVLLGSQTLGGAYSLARTTIGQMAVRIALQCSEDDSQLILDDHNTAARLLSRPGEAIYNDAGGLVEGNSPFQTAWLSDESRDEYLNRVSNLVHKLPDRREPTIVFEGNALSDIRKNRALSELLEAFDWPESCTAPRIWLGEAVAIKDPTCATFRRLSGAHLLMVGQREDAAMAIMTAAMLCLAAQQRRKSARFYILDGTPADSSLAGVLQRVASVLPHSVRIVKWREVPEAITELTDEMRQRLQSDRTDTPSIYLLIYGLQRYRILRRSEDDFSFSMDDADKPPSPDKQFAELLREGPPLGIHTLTWSDTLAALERTLDRQSLREFDNRILFQMSASDSSNLIDSPVANKLGYYRALFYSEEQGLMEKFRPYALPEEDWLKRIKKSLNRKSK
ncbi:MAG: cell division protein FtsK [Planctomycetota bacterium]|nr:MAG: cell division protein FtsK [Planctomycetota bacterium]